MSNLKPQDEDLITIPVKDFIQSHLGISTENGTCDSNIVPNQHIWSHRPISTRLATILFEKYHNKSVCYIEFPSEFSMQRDPILWAYNEWVQSNEFEERRRARADEERTERFLYIDNRETVARNLMKKFGFDYDKALEMAGNALKKGNKGILMISETGKLKTRKEEL